MARVEGWHTLATTMSRTLQDVLARDLPTLDAREGTGITGAVKVSMNDGTINGRFKKRKTGLTEDGSGPQYSSQWSKRRWQHHWNTPMTFAIDSQRSLQVTKIWLIPLPRQLGLWRDWRTRGWTSLYWNWRFCNRGRFVTWRNMWGLKQLLHN